MIITIAGDSYTPASNSLRIDNRIEERTVASFAVNDPGSAYTFRKGQPVEIENGGTRIFAGVVDSARERVIDNQTYKRHMITCVDYHYAADKRLAAKAYEDEQVSEIVIDLWESYLVDEGITAGDVRGCNFINFFNMVNVKAHGLENGDMIRFYTKGTLPAELNTGQWYYIVNKTTDTFQVSETEGGSVVAFTDDGTETGGHSYQHNFAIANGSVIEEAVFNYIPVADSLDALAERTGFWWMIDANRKLHFVDRGEYTAPWTATADEMRSESVVVEHSNPKYRNKQVIKGPRDLTSVQTEVQMGDGEKQSFTVGYPIAKVPTVRIDIGAGWVAQTVGIKGIDEGVNWYWNKGDSTVTQDTGGAALGAAHKIEVSYRGEFPIVIISQDNTEIYNRQTIETIGTGIVEEVQNESQQSTREAAFQLAAQLLEKYGSLGRVIIFETQEEGLEPGQLLTVNLPGHGLNSTEMLIESVTMYDESNLLWYRVKAFEGPEMKSWASVFKEIVKRGEFQIREGIGAGEVIIIPIQLSKTWTEVGDDPNIFIEIYPDAAHTPGGIYPSFDPDHRVRYLEWHDAGGAVERKAVTQQTGADTAEIFSLTYMDPADGAGVEVTHFAWIGGIDATETLATGLEVDKQAHPDGATTKSFLAAWQVEKTDTKWS